MQAEACESLGSPFTARLCRLAGERLAVEQGPVARRILEWPGDPTYNADSVPLRFAGGLHALVLSGAAPGLAALYPPYHETADDAVLWRAVAAAMMEHEGHVQRWLDGPPQTNEVRRAAALYLGLMTIARETGLPLVLSEIGSSGGLNLNLDRYAYRFGDAARGDAASPLTLAPRWHGPEPEPVTVNLVERRGCDINPLDINKLEDCLRLLSYLWADQSERLALTQAALAVAAAHPVTVERSDAAAFIARRLAEAPSGRAHVVAHTIMWQYMPEATQDAIRARLQASGTEATADRPLAWLRFEPDDRKPGGAVTLTLWPGGGEREIARCDFHGRWLAAGEG
ncbi:MAG: DUF2332 domain-containing protein [Kiloniellales bacterium]